jgi:hypothetical protein
VEDTDNDHSVDGRTVQCVIHLTHPLTDEYGRTCWWSLNDEQLTPTVPSLVAKPVLCHCHVTTALVLHRCLFAMRTAVESARW